MCCLMTDLALTTLIPNKNPQEYRIFHFFPFRFSLNNVSLFVNISDIFRPFDALRTATAGAKGRNDGKYGGKRQKR